MQAVAGIENWLLTLNGTRGTRSLRAEVANDHKTLSELSTTTSPSVVRASTVPEVTASGLGVGR